jgi:16S rRNA (guanine(966)-N(2))-methyltransferase RsmD
MRVVAGSARGLRLRGPSSEGTRPISDRAKEALFNILGRDVVGGRFLDLFAGTGAVGVEALSRGAAAATFVERDRTAVADIEANLEHTRLGDGAQVVTADVFRWLERGTGPFDVVFCGPPQWEGLWGRSLAALDASEGVLADGARVVVQLDPKEEADEPVLDRLRFDQRRAYGNVLLRFYSCPRPPHRGGT